MLSTNNIFTPATGRRSRAGQDMVFGAYYLTLPADEERPNPPVFRHVYEIENALADKTLVSARRSRSVPRRVRRSIPV